MLAELIKAGIAPDKCKVAVEWVDPDSPEVTNVFYCENFEQLKEWLEHGTKGVKH